MPTKHTNDTKGQVVTEAPSFTWWVTAWKSPMSWSFRETLKHLFNHEWTQRNTNESQAFRSSFVLVCVHSWFNQRFLSVFRGFQLRNLG